MPTISQLVRKGRKSIERTTKSPALRMCPQKRGVCVRVYTTTPKKPELCLKEGSKDEADEWDGGLSLYPRSRAQSSGTFYSDD